MADATPREIERKFLVRELPDKLEELPQESIAQGYLVCEEDGTQVRLRRVAAGREGSPRFILTFKRGAAGTSREEREIELTVPQFEMLWPATEGKRLEKTRHRMPWRDHVVEIDIYHGCHEGIVVAEVEFDDRQSCEEFVPPEWLGDDVTGDPRYSNQLLAS